MCPMSHTSRWSWDWRLPPKSRPYLTAALSSILIASIPETGYLRVTSVLESHLLSQEEPEIFPSYVIISFFITVPKTRYCNSLVMFLGVPHSLSCLTAGATLL